MTRQRMKLPGSLLVTSLLYCGLSRCGAASFENKTDSNEKIGPRVFAPRMDYDEWTPLGRGDPLKNDPTFDYVPPILDRVQYWMDSHTTEASSKSDILVLGVTAKKTSPKIPEQFLKFVNGPKFMRNQEPQGSYVNDFTGSRGAELPKLIRKTTFRNRIKDYRNQDRIESVPASYYSSSYYNQNSKPETMMLPPPVIRNPDANRPHRIYEGLTKNYQYSDKHRYGTQTEAGSIVQLKHQMYDPPKNSYFLHDEPLPPKPSRKHNIQATSDTEKLTTKGISVFQVEAMESYAPSSELPITRHGHESTTASVSSEKSNLIYQSSQTISDGWLAKTRRPAQPSSVDFHSVTWKTDASTDNREDLYEEDIHQAAGSSHHEVVLGPNSNIIVEGDGSDKEEIVIGQKEIMQPSEPSSDETMEEEKDATPRTAPVSDSENMYIVLANSSPSETTIERSKEESAGVTVVMPENFLYKNLDGTTTREEKLSQTPSTPLDTRLAAEIDKPMPHRSFENLLTHPQGTVHTIDAPVRSHSPTRPAVSYRQTPTRQGPHTDIEDAPPQRVIHHQPSHARPDRVTMHYTPHLGTGMVMNFRETSPPPPPSPVYSGMPVGHVKLNMRYGQMQPFKTIITSRPGMKNVKQHNQPHNFYQHRFVTSVPTTMTSNSIVRSVTSIPINRIRDLLLKDEAHHKSQMMPEIIETMGSTSSRTPSDVEISSNINITKDNVESHFAVQVKDDYTRRKIVSTSESSIAPTSAIPPTTIAALTTDPIFSHYNQPANPIRGPMYLIIQGHSKVKTYKPWVDKHANQVEKKENVESTTSKRISEFEKFVKENTKKIADAEKIKETRKTTERPADHSIEQDSLLSFIDSGLGMLPVSLSRRDLDDKNSN